MEPSNFDIYFIPRIMQLMVYGPLPVKKHARQAILHLVESKNYPSESNEYRSHIDKAKFHCDEIHTAMMEDMDSHFYRADMEKWKEQVLSAREENTQEK